MVKVAFIIIPSVLVLSAVQGSRKKGAAVSSKAYKCDDFNALNKIAWWYNWSKNLDSIERRSGCNIEQKHAQKYIPMIWGYKPSWFTNFYVEENTDFILGFNEPNHDQQSNLTAQEAVDAWPTVEYYADGRAIVSPAAAFCGGDTCVTTTSEEWFDQFFELLCVNGTTIPCRVTYLATHIYPYNCNAVKMMTELESLYQRYGLKIWLTEFACPYTTSAEVQLDFMKTVLPLLEKADHVFRYAWYVHRSSSPSRFIPESANLFETNSSTLTPLGQYYNEFTLEEPRPPGVCLRGKTK